MTTAESWVLAYFVNSLWQVPLLFVAGLLAARALRPLGPEGEHRVWVGVLLLQGVLPACSVAQFAWLRALLVWETAARTPADAQVTVIMGKGIAPGVFQFPGLVLSASVLACSAVIFYFTVRFIWRWSQLNEMRRDSAPMALSGEAARGWAQCSERFHIQNATLAISSRVFAPVTLGIRRKLLLLPAGIAHRISEAEMHTVIAHEFAHMRRNDFLKNLLYELLALPVSYHPALWLTRARITESREIICDRLAAGLAGRSQYTRSLLRLASLVLESAPARAAHAVGIFDTNTLERRLMKLAEKQSEIRGVRRFAAVAASLALGAATCASALALRMQVNSTEVSGQHPIANPAAVNVPAKKMEQNIISKVPPKYPVEAKKARIQGKVVLDAIIGKDGSVKSLKVDSGPKELRQSSLDAVKQWKYKPVLLNGEPVEVKTTVTITYTLKK